MDPKISYAIVKNNTYNTYGIPIIHIVTRIAAPTIVTTQRWKQN